MKNKFDLKKILLIAFALIFLQNMNFFKNFFFIMTKDYNQRFINDYFNSNFSGYCQREAHGYVSYIKNKFELETPPKLINFDKQRRKLPYWIFYNRYLKIDSDKVILLNFTDNDNFDFSKFEIVDSFDDKCFYLKKVNNGTS